MKKIFAVFLCMLFSYSLGAEIFSNGNLYGIKNDGKITAEAKYDKIIQLQYVPIKTVLVPMQSTKENKPVKLDSYKASLNGFWGVIDENGKKLCDFKYDDIKVNEYGEIIVVKDKEETLLNPVKNTMKKTTKTIESVVGLPVTIVAGALMPIEVISKIGKK